MGLNMRFVLLFGALFVCVILTGCNQVTAPQELTGDNEQTNQLADPIIQTDQTDVIDGAEDLINQFFGDWKSKGHNVIFEFRDGNGFFGYIESEIYSRIEFLISEVNLEEQSIVITGYDTRYDDDYEPFTEQFASKIYLINGGEELLYVNDYLNDSYESEWIRYEAAKETADELG